MKLSEKGKVREYVLIEQIGEGGFGSVWKAHQPSVNRDVAIKMIHPEQSGSPEFIRRFEAEAQLVAKLEHPHIVPLYDYWRDPDGAFLVMRLLRGGSLLNLMTSGMMGLETVLRVMSQIGEALHAAHQQGVVHRDVKPANVLLDEDGRAYLTDFGIAKTGANQNALESTQDGRITGSPGYMSPEQVQGMAVSPFTDQYSLGVMLFEMLTGKHPFEGDSSIQMIMRHLSDPLPPLASLRPDLPDALDQIVQTATAKDATGRYKDSLEIVARLQEVIRPQAIPTPTSLEEKPLTGQNPYKGLRAFQEADAVDFFGRGALTQQLTRQLRNTRFLAVVGPSGSGKSSAVRAGLLPDLRTSGIPGTESWIMVDMFPGAHPFEELEAALYRIAIEQVPGLYEQLTGENGVLRAVKRILPNNDADLLLFIDQFEELFTLVEDVTIRERFLNSLYVAVTDPRSRLRVVVALRADFYDRPLQYPDFGQLMRVNTEVVLPMTESELVEAITKPVERLGGMVEPVLVENILADVRRQPGILPMLQYAMTELFERRVGSVLTRSAYNQLGGVKGALTQRADEVFNRLGADGRSAARQMFLRLVTLGEGQEDTRRRVLRSELKSLSSEMDGVIDIFGRARLLTFDRDPETRAPTVEVAHESLLREWPRLRSWLDDNRDDLRHQRQLHSAVEDWFASGKDPSYLLHGSRLAVFDSWRQQTSLVMTPDELAFLDEGIALHERGLVEEAERQRRELALAQRARKILQTLAIVLAAAAFFGVLLSVFAFNQRSIAQANADTAATAQADAEFQAKLAEENAAEARAQTAALVISQSEAEANAVEAESQREQADEQRALAEDQARTALAYYLAIQSGEVDPSLALLLSIEGFNMQVTAQTRKALIEAIEAVPLEGDRFEVPNGDPDVTEYWPWAMELSPDGTKLAFLIDYFFQETDAIVFWDTVTMQPLEGWNGETYFTIPDLNLSAKGDSFWGAITFHPSEDVLFISVCDRMETFMHPETESEVNNCADQTLRVMSTAEGELGRWLGYMPLESMQFNGPIKMTDDGEFLLADICLDEEPGRNFLDCENWGIQVMSVDEVLAHILDGGPAPDLRAFPVPGWVYGLYISPDRSTILVENCTQKELFLGANGYLGINCLESVLSLHQFETGEVLATTALGDIELNGLVWMRGGKDILLSMCEWLPYLDDYECAHSLRWLDADTLELTDEKKFPHLIGQLTLSSTGRYLVIRAGETGLSSMIWDITDDRWYGPFEAYMSRADFNADDTILYSLAVEQRWMARWDMTELGGIGRTLDRIDFSTQATNFLPGKKQLVDLFPDALYLWNADSKSPDFGRQVEGSPFPVDPVNSFWPGGVSHDERYFVASGWGGTITLFDMDTLSVVGEPIQTDPDNVFAAEFRPGDDYIAAAGGTGSLVFWDVASIIAGNPVSITTEGHLAGVIDLAFSDDGTRLATVSWDGSAGYWDTDPESDTFGQRLGAMRGHQDLALGLAISPDGRFLATVGDGGDLFIWDLETFQVFGAVIRTHDSMWNAAFSSDGKTLVTAHFGNTIRFWDVDPESRTFGQPVSPVLKAHSDPAAFLDGVNNMYFFNDDLTLVSGASDGRLVGWNLDPAYWLELACAKSRRNMTRLEWEAHMPGIAYRATCPAYPLEGE